MITTSIQNPKLRIPYRSNSVVNSEDIHNQPIINFLKKERKQEKL